MCITFGHVARALFVAHQDVANRRLDQRIVCRQDATAGKTEHHIHVLHLQSTNKRLRTGDGLTSLVAFHVIC